MAVENEFKYDVAFSFLTQDEPLAFHLRDRLKNVSTFIYSDPERQKLLAGRDGEAEFSRVFSEQSRTVVVLYRQGWGDRGFTYIEANAIRNRAYEYGYDFATFIPLDKPRTVPPWVPKNRIWVDLDRWGIDHAAAVIESRVQEAGGTLKIESLAHAAGRAARDLKRVQAADEFYHSERGVQTLRSEFERIYLELDRICTESGGLLTKLERRGPEGSSFGMRGDQWRTVVRLENQIINSLNEAGVHVELWHEQFSGFPHRRDGRPETVETFIVELDFNGQPRWRSSRMADGEQSLTTAELAERAARQLIDHIVAERARRSLERRR